MHFVSPTDGSDPSAVLESISRHARVLTRGTGAAIVLAHKEYMICRASVGNAPTIGALLDVSTGFSEECVRTGKTLRCDNSDSDPRVDAESCRRLGIRSILAAPIRFGGAVVGILEVFSSQRFNFHDGDLAVVEHLAQTVFVVPPSANTRPLVKTTLPVKSALPVKITPPVKTVPAAVSTLPPKLLLELEPAWQVFLGNLTDLLFPPRIAPLKLTSRPAAFWPDVLVPSLLPWDRFVQAILMQVTMVAVLGLVGLGLSQRPQLRHSRLGFNKSDVIYYLPPEYMESLRRESESSPSRPTARLTFVKPPFISVHRESGSRFQRSIAPPALHLKKNSRFRMMAGNPTVPAVPFSATTGSQRRAPANSVAVVAPAPDTTGLQAPHLTLATPQVIQPAPSVDESVHQMASISLGHQEVVRPAPEVRELGSASTMARATLGKAATPVVPPPPSVHPAIHQTENISLGHVEVVRPAPEIHELGSLPSTAQATLGKASTTVVPPPPSVHHPIHQMESLSVGRLQVVGPAPEITLQEQHSLSTTIQATLGRAATPVVPPAPSVGGLGNSGQRMGSRPSADTHVVPPPPALLQIAGSYLIDTPDGGAILVVPPAPSIGSLEHRSGHSASSVGSGGAQAVVPPPPRLQGTGAPGRGTGNGMAMAVVPPPPSVGGLGGFGGRSSSSQRAAGRQMAQPKIAVPTGGGEATQGQKSTAGASGLPGGKLPGEITGNTGKAHPDSKKAIAANAAPDYDCWGYGCTSADELRNTKQLRISFIGPALAFPQSSYFSNFEVFIAEERLGRHQSRVIKLVYDLLTYQPRLSALGPDYPALENLHATRDPSCDEPLKQVVSLASTLHWPQASLAQLSATSAKQRQTTLPCYRTTAGDYRKAVAREHRVEDK